MALQVDLIENDWSAGEQRVVARLTISRGVPDLNSADIPRWSNLLELQKIKTPILDADIPNVLEQIHKRFQGDYLFVTEPHDEDDCRYLDVVHLQAPGKAAPERPRPARIA